MLSYTSSRMTPGAQELLSILSLLPDGLADADLVQAKLPIPDILEHFHQLLDLWNQFKNLNGLEREGPDIIQNSTSILFLNQFYDRVQNTYSPLLLQLSGQMLHWEGHLIFGEYLIELLQSSDHLPDLDFNSHITLGTQHFISKDPLEQDKTQSLTFSRWYCALGVHLLLAKLDMVGALESHKRAYSLAESVGYPSTVGIHALTSICNILSMTGKHLNALTHAKKAYRYAEHMGDIYLQAFSLWCQGRCHTRLANYQHAQCLLQKARQMLATLGQQQSGLSLFILNWQAEIDLVKTEYLESRNLQVALASSCQPTSYTAILANLNMALIDIATGAESKNIHQNLDMAQPHLKALFGYHGKYLCLTADLAAAELCLRSGALGTVNAMFEKCFASALDIDRDLGLLCAEKLADFSTGMNDIRTTL
ncbi:hypothetical protein C8J57DRAFT_1249419 [Mycena rebaudengoi]|nr:hypothetical protein C8J57DRAFT_1249419 [Mycena rebaudengoi]